MKNTLKLMSVKNGRKDHQRYICSYKKSDSNSRVALKYVKVN